MRKLVSMAVAMALVVALPAAGAQAKTKQISTSIYLDVAGLIDRHGGVYYLWDGELSAKRSACRDGRNVTLFRVEPNGTATPVGSSTTLGDPFGSFGELLEGPLDAITGYYYAEVAPKRVRTKQKKKQKKGQSPVTPVPVIGRSSRARKVTLNCLAARSSTIYVEVPAGLLTSP
jgi:hypothetical protein